jgi:ATP-dependent NAD(P)H-hydrate dehydratase
MSSPQQQSQQQHIQAVSKVIPSMKSMKKKGDGGRVGIVGGSFEYTGAPYYTGISALKTVTRYFKHK